MLILADNNPIRHIRRPYVNWGLIALCTVVFIFPVSYQSFGFVPATLLNALQGGVSVVSPAPSTSDWAQLVGTSVSYIFLHGSLLHLVGNMIALWIFGNNVEDSMGHWRYPAFFVLCGMGGAIAQGLMTQQPHVPVVGASGSIAGVMSAYLLLHPRARLLVLVAMRVPVLVPASVVVGLTIITDVTSAMLPQQGEQLIAFWAHIGGFVTGVVLILFMRQRDVSLLQPAAIYPEPAFGGLSRLMINLGPRPGSYSENACWRRKVWFWIKTSVFLLVITLVAEMVLL